ncbi:MAG: DNA polymerase V [Gammaproteobacteria bacterium]|nr:DNA polymerase V [Gammaproteobacteria bacterium]MAY01698.1 DNA polymerase V [Gammaproteobacteria bacterium]|tara:strand:- start:13140 stop:13571 length:432 start_codon:yes stop_codon:yes gene_type:complete
MKVFHLAKSEVASYLPLPFFTSQVAAGFPSPADDYIENGLDLNEYLIRHPSSTYFVRASGDSMTGCGIQDGALLIVDRAASPRQGSIVIAAIDGELTCKILDIRNKQLLAANPAYSPIPIAEMSELNIEGVVLHAVNSLCMPW